MVSIYDKLRLSVIVLSIDAYVIQHKLYLLVTIPIDTLYPG